MEVGSDGGVGAGMGGGGGEGGTTWGQGVRVGAGMGGHEGEGGVVCSYFLCPGLAHICGVGLGAVQLFLGLAHSIAIVCVHLRTNSILPFAARADM